MNKCYVVVENNREYNDEFYYFTDGGRPNNVFLEKGRAEEQCLELNKKEFQELNLMEWLQDGIEIDEEFIRYFPTFEKFLEKDSFDLGYEDLILPKELTNEQVKYLIKLTHLKFYEVIKTEFVGGDFSVGVE